MKINLRKLEHAVILAEEGNYKKAALRLCITQPALSRSIAKLEEEMGFKIFERAQAGVGITTLGKRFIERAHKLVRHAGDMDYDMSLARKGMGGDLAFGMGPYPEAAFLVGLLQVILDFRKGIRVRAEVSSPENLLGQLEAKEIEFFLANAERLNLGPELTSFPLAKLNLAFFVRNRHPLLMESISDGGELLPFQLIGTVASSVQVMRLKRRLNLPEFLDFQFLIACNDIHVLKTLALNNDLILIAPELALNDEDRKKFGKLRFSGPLAGLSETSVEINLIRFLNRDLSPAAKLAIEVLHNMLDKN
jgi:DNA-binding transcriptional LysR family regulator